MKAIDLMQQENAEHIPQFEAAGRMTTKLLLAFAGHVELLDKLKRGGRQTVRVENVHVHAGGQAVVGQVTTGGGVRDEIERLPHAPVALPGGTAGHVASECGSEVLSQDPRREPLPIPRSQG